ncbi:MAG: YihY family inner membrane protein [Gammaproteobacteria bacterium]|nr:YihY family inner membrane protein [Gammaproteobacteria bacterium]MBU6510148.1 YihY family inner membrane protein [Gammaproteobacteria bacterium]MDE1983903.1 YihY family inner membrane protein [Gammaproteobacteria bacterium]MDE2108266.1 YihY family inner membrane protein [Gammaproteobacteria bacterium]
MLNRISKTINRYIWYGDLHGMPLHKRVPILWLRMLQVLVQDFADGGITLRAMSLVYTTLLAIVPLLAFVFAVLKGLGVQDNLEPLLLDFLAPLGEKGEELSGRIINFVDHVRAGVLGIVGLLVLMYAVVALVQKVESGLNYVWHVREVRSFGERFSHYLGVILIAPLLVVAAFGITATVSSHTVMDNIVALGASGHLLLLATKVVPYLMVIAAFTFIYAFVPHTHVRLRAAFAGGMVAGILWEFAGWAFAVLTVSSTRLTLIYSGFAILVMFMAWIYLSWLILLVGAQVAFYAQNPELVRRRRREDVGGRTLERLALHIMYLVGRSYHDSKQPWSREELARRLRVPTESVLGVLGRLRENGLLMLISGRIRRYVPGRDMGTITLQDIVNAMRLNPSGAEDVDFYLRGVVAVDTVVNRLDHAIESALGKTTLRELVEQQAVIDIADVRRA